MTFLGLSLVWWTLLASYALVGIVAFACLWVADIADRARRNRPVILLSPLPMCVAIPTRHRRANPGVWS